LRKDQGEAAARTPARGNSIDSLRSPISVRSPVLSNVPEEQSAFAIGDDDDEEDSDDDTLQDESSRPLQESTASIESSRAQSMSPSTDEAVPIQLRGMSEKARGKMPVGQASFSRQNSISSLHSLAPTISYAGQFQPTAEWVSNLSQSLQ
jgi:hypothetical protein